jgi:hypothetical protein
MFMVGRCYSFVLSRIPHETANFIIKERTYRVILKVYVKEIQNIRFILFAKQIFDTYIPPIL